MKTILSLILVSLSAVFSGCTIAPMTTIATFPSSVAAEEAKPQKADAWTAKVAGQSIKFGNTDPSIVVVQNPYRNRSISAKLVFFKWSGRGQGSRDPLLGTYSGVLIRKSSQTVSGKVGESVSIKFPTIPYPGEQVAVLVTFFDESGANTGGASDTFYPTQGSYSYDLNPPHEFTAREGSYAYGWEPARM